ncbi:phosphoribosyltransferase family protein [Streptomyces sp. KR80]|uniref:phosphoribosyltransferase family protein n=1 Tax=Streptomyces sp. KR80 TaxID=3457426 RepID=UPI003FD108E3
MQFTDRTEAGRLLAEHLEHLRSENPVVLGLPRGGVPVAFEVAQALDAPLDVILVRKLGVPYHRELGYGAIGEDGVRVIHEHILQMSRADEGQLAAIERDEEAELRRQAERFRGGRERVPLEGRTAIVVDDGIATGATAAAACRVAQAHGASRVVLAVPVAPPDAVVSLRPEVDELVCLSTPTAFFAVGEWYDDFSQTSDDEVMDLLARATATSAPQGTPNPGSQASGEPEIREVEIPVPQDRVVLTGDICVPDGAPGIVAFAHGSGSSRHSPRNRAVAAALNDAGLGTLLFDLLTLDEELDRANVFDVETLGRRLLEATRMLSGEKVPVGYFGASTGAAAALWAAAAVGTEGADVAAVVSRGGRPDLAGPRLGAVRAPTLLIVGGRDETVIDLNRRAQSRMTCENRLAVVPGATHLFEEPGALETVADLARDWFLDHFATAPTAAR